MLDSGFTVTLLCRFSSGRWGVMANGGTELGQMPATISGHKAPAEQENFRGSFICDITSNKP